MPGSTVFYFNPTCELAVANCEFSYMPPKLLREFEEDCSILPFVFAAPNDVVLTGKKPSAAFTKKFAEAGFELPDFFSLEELITKRSIAINSILPWGWSPAAHFILKDLKEKCLLEFRESPVYHWLDEHKKLVERETSLRFLEKTLNECPRDFFIGPEMTGIKVTGMEEIELQMKKWGAIVLKAPLSSAGRGIQIIRKQILNSSNKQWITGILKQQKYLIAEPFLDKLADLSFQFEVTENGGISYLGRTFFETNTNGQYKGTRLNPDLNQLFPDVNALELGKIVDDTAQILRAALNESDYPVFYRGYLGVDALIFRHDEKTLIQPCIEINCRMNMGGLALILEKKISGKSTGRFELFYGSPGEYQAFCTKQTAINPPKLRDGKLSSGFMPLVEPDPEKKFGAYISLVESR